MSAERFTSWLAAYERAWRTGDPHLLRPLDHGARRHGAGHVATLNRVPLTRPDIAGSADQLLDAGYGLWLVSHGAVLEQLDGHPLGVEVAAP